MAISAVQIERPADKKVDMKSVDRTPEKFKRTFSGAAHEDWIDHINTLELTCAKKNAWTAKQFYYALQLTVTGPALKAWDALDRDEHLPDLGELLSDWFECEPAEYKALIEKQIVFSQLSERSQLAVIIVYFFHRF